MSDETTKREETLADIVAELREISKMPTCGYICQEQIAEYADRIEAAGKRAEESHKRELDRAVLNKDFLDSMRYLVEVARLEGIRRDVDNAAKLREALAALVDYWNWGGYDAGRILRLQDDARAAIALPPRNCDRFATLKDAQEAFFPCYIPCYTQTRVGAFLDWIFAPAVQEGGEP